MVGRKYFNDEKKANYGTLGPSRIPIRIIHLFCGHLSIPYNGHTSASRSHVFHIKKISQQPESRVASLFKQLTLLTSTATNTQYFSIAKKAPVVSTAMTSKLKYACDL
jgi:hypothetical protein